MKVTVDIKRESRKTGIFSSKEMVIAYLTIELSEEEKHIVEEDKLGDLLVALRPKAEHEFNSSEKFRAKHAKDFEWPLVSIMLGDFLHQSTHEHYFDDIPTAQNFELGVLKGLKSAKARLTERVQAADLGPKTYEL